MARAGLAWKTAWITGASSGMGRELALLLDAEVARVAISARSADQLDSMAAEGKTLAAYPLDVTNGVAVTDCVTAIEAAAGPIDLAVLNAGVWTLMDVDSLDAGAIRHAMEVNYLGVINALAALIPRMIARGKGHIAIVASVAGYRGLPRAIAYGPTKAALINLAETLRSELAPRGITVSLVNPGFVDTPATRTNPFPMPALMPASVAAQRMLEGLRKRRFEIIFPRRFVWAMKVLRTLPDPVYFWVVRTFIMPSKS